MAPPNTPAAPVETKGAKFARLAPARVNNALKAISNIGGLAAKNNYEFTDAQVDKIEGALKAELEVLMNRFRKPDAVKTTGFTL